MLKSHCGCPTITILALGLMAVIFAFSMGATGNEEDPIGFFNSVLETFKKAYYPGYIAFLGIQGDILKFILFVIISLIPFGLFLWFASSTYLKANSNQSISVVKEDFVIKEERSSSPLKALVFKELRGYFGIPVYVINTIFGPIISVLVTFMLLSQMKADFLQVGEKLIEMKMILPPLILIMMVFSLSIVSTTASSISLEGKNMWILKSLPVKEKEIFSAKIFINLLITIPAIVINVIILNVYSDVKVLDNIMILLITTISILIVSKMGLYINLLFPKIDFDQPARVVKQGLSVLITMIFSSVYTLIISGVGILGYILSGKITFGYITAFVFGALVYLLSTLLLKISGVKQFKKIQC